MSRVVKNNDTYSFVFGLDRITGPFFQIWEQPAEKQDCALLVADNTGITLDERAHGHLPRWLVLLFHETRARYDRARQLGNLHPNLDAQTICDFARACGFNDLYMEIADTLDNHP